jgi:hypothetical protein
LFPLAPHQSALNLAQRKVKESSSFLKKRTKRLLKIGCALVQRLRQFLKVFASFFKNKCFLPAAGQPQRRPG